jgi:ABC-2 type transport system permease protein
MMVTARAMVRKELRQIMRDRRTLLILVFVPALFLLLYGYALNFDIRNIDLAVEDQDGSTASRELISAFTNSGYFTYVGAAHSQRELDWLIDTNAARAALVIRRLRARSCEPRACARAGGVTATTPTRRRVVGYAGAIVAEAGAEMLAQRGGGAGTRARS